jgi:GntR family transcriptional regulator
MRSPSRPAARVAGRHTRAQELGERYQVSRNTVRLALGLLANEGIISTTPGRGTFVRERVALTYYASRAQAADRPDDWHTGAYFTEVRQQGRQPSQAFEIRIESASLAVAERLGVEEGQAVVVRRMIRYVDDEPWSIQDSSFPMASCRGPRPAPPTPSGWI